MPGHFVHFLHANRVPSLIGRVFVGYGYAEGWAHYAEEMMWEAGLGGGRADIISVNCRTRCCVTAGFSQRSGCVRAA